MCSSSASKDESTRTIFGRLFYPDMFAEEKHLRQIERRTRHPRWLFFSFSFRVSYCSWASLILCVPLILSCVRTGLFLFRRLTITGQKPSQRQLPSCLHSLSLLQSPVGSHLSISSHWCDVFQLFQWFCVLRSDSVCIPLLFSFPSFHVPQSCDYIGIFVSYSLPCGGMTIFPCSDSYGWSAKVIPSEYMHDGCPLLPEPIRSRENFNNCAKKAIHQFQFWLGIGTTRCTWELELNWINSYHNKLEPIYIWLNHLNWQCDLLEPVEID